MYTYGVVKSTKSVLNGREKPVNLLLTVGTFITGENPHSSEIHCNPNCTFQQILHW